MTTIDRQSAGGGGTATAEPEEVGVNLYAKRQDGFFELENATLAAQYEKRNGKPLDLTVKNGQPVPVEAQIEFAKAHGFGYSEEAGLPGGKTEGASEHSRHRIKGADVSGHCLDSHHLRNTEIEDCNFDNVSADHADHINVTFVRTLAGKPTCSGYAMISRGGRAFNCDYRGLGTIENGDFSGKTIDGRTKFCGLDARGTNMTGMLFVWEEGERPLQAKELLDMYQRGDDAAKAKVKAYIMGIFEGVIWNPQTTKMDDALRVLFKEFSEDYTGSLASRSKLSCLQDIRDRVEDGLLFEDFNCEHRDHKFYTITDKDNPVVIEFELIGKGIPDDYLSNQVRIKWHGFADSAFVDGPPFSSFGAFKNEDTGAFEFGEDLSVDQGYQVLIALIRESRKQRDFPVDQQIVNDTPEEGASQQTSAPILDQSVDEVDEALTDILSGGFSVENQEKRKQ